MRFWLLLAPLLGPDFFRCFLLFFALGMGVVLYSLLRA